MKCHVVVPVAYGGFFKEDEQGCYTHTLSEMNEYNIKADTRYNSNGTHSLTLLLDKGWKIIDTQTCSCGEGNALRAVFQYILESPELPDNAANKS